MKNMAGNSGAHLPVLVPACSAQQRRITYLAMIAIVLQDAPDHMLTFTEMMDKLEPFVYGNRKAFENNIRVCLSVYKCFAKIPMSSEITVCKRHSWKLDHSQITAKMVRRHFRGILHRFPELACREGTDMWSGAAEPCTALHSPEAAVQIRCEVKFTGPFSIESLLKRDSPSAAASKASPPSGVPVRADQPPCSAERGTGTKRSFSWDSAPEEPLLLQASGGHYPVCTTGGSTGHELSADGTGKPNIKRMNVFAEPSVLLYTRPRAAPYFSSTQSCYTKYPVHTFTHNAHRFLSN
ncbi:forkhead box protein H1-like [Myripristis murdjan]|uniref:forkhead box protein H1-like n=1 Tax=Myripristis murdjan TaxID=586833 RepID=UPI001176410F|nr:forkhead box protein H1-like [Myripristis murdjan]